MRTAITSAKQIERQLYLAIDNMSVRRTGVALSKGSKQNDGLGLITRQARY